MFKNIKYIVGCILFGAAMFIIFWANWSFSKYGKQPVDSMIYTLLNSISLSSKTLIYDFLLKCALPTLISTIVIFLFIFNPFKTILKLSIRNKEFIIYPINIVNRFFLLINFIFLIITAVIVADMFGVTKFIVAQTKSSDFIGENYVDPENVNIVFPSQKRNLIYIYVESLESAFFSKSLGGYMEQNLLPKLTELTNDETNFSNSNLLGGAVDAVGTSWSIAGMVAEMGGIPLKVDIGGNEYGSDSSFLPGAYTLGDILEKEGYNQMFMAGSDAKFGGRKYYYKLHGNYDIYDYYSAINDNKIEGGYYVWWGFEDKKLYSFAKDEITKLASENKPFNFTLATADTHFPDGYLDETCTNKTKYDEQFNNVVACTDEMLYNFISWIKEQEFYKNTTIVIVGDHLSMDVNFANSISEGYTRTVYNLYINSAITSENTKNRGFATFDLFPTTLASMGVIIDGDKLGLGTNLFSNKQTLVEQYGIDYINEELNKKSAFYNSNLLES